MSTNTDVLLNIQGPSLRPISKDTVIVSLGSAIIDDIVKAYHRAVSNKMSSRFREFDISEEELQAYFNTLVKYRVDGVNGKRVEKRSRYLMIPSLLSLAILKIGRVEDRTLGIVLYPEFEPKDTLGIEEMERVSEVLLQIEDHGFSLVQGLPRDYIGDQEFMFFHHANGVVTRHNDAAAPGIAVLTAFFKFEQMHSLLSFRVDYGLVEDYQDMLRDLIYDESRAKV